MIATLSPRARPMAASPQASARTSSYIWRQVQPCQMPRSFSRMAILLGCCRVRASNSLGNVSRRLSWGMRGFSIDDYRYHCTRDTAEMCPTVRFQGRHCALQGKKLQCQISLYGSYLTGITGHAPQGLVQYVPAGSP